MLGLDLVKKIDLGLRDPYRVELDSSRTAGCGVSKPTAWTRHGPNWHISSPNPNCASIAGNGNG
ncbi:hypothetical protein [Sagittula sp. S175]|uniref:hypothetical protein n=1 Tax=Sagittula sp. S175 TaxID=3415129 RepID=UPI003C7BA9F2